MTVGIATCMTTEDVPSRMAGDNILVSTTISVRILILFYTNERRFIEMVRNPPSSDGVRRSVYFDSSAEP
jgi:hypothetical protein